MKIGIIGGGNMGSAMAQAFISKNITKAENITIIDLNEEKLNALQAELEVQTSQNSTDIIDSDILLIAVKPQGFEEMAKSISGKIKEDCIVISVMAAVSLKKVSECLNHAKVARCMPNTPSLIQAGVLAWMTTDGFSADEKIMINDLLSSCGYAFEVNSEEEINTVSYISGCGPGFFYFVMEEWLKGAKHLKLDEEKKKELLMKTVMGSLLLSNTSEKPLSELREQVTSKGGITAEGLKELEKGNLHQTFENMFKAAARRTNELN
ncbi:MAG: pyrroline-5-carboxylate reductase [Candidatus Gracilibacteria bacterium]|nr:pyrroline-5-carboxylate reductase [Candidatus Gracilibacteria bacterium]